MIAPTNGDGIYYTGPSENWSRPGRMWWSVPEGIEEFSTWQEISTASVHSYNLGNDFTPTGLSGTGSIVFGIRANADSSTTEILNGQLTVTVINV